MAGIQKPGIYTTSEQAWCVYSWWLLHHNKQKLPLLGSSRPRRGCVQSFAALRASSSRALWFVLRNVSCNAVGVFFFLSAYSLLAYCWAVRTYAIFYTAYVLQAWHPLASFITRWTHVPLYEPTAYQCMLLGGGAALLGLDVRRVRQTCSNWPALRRISCFFLGRL